VNFAGKILLADDEAHIRKFVGLLLRKLGAPTVIEARHGQYAVDAYARENPNLVLLDVSMAEMSPWGDCVMRLSIWADKAARESAASLLIFRSERSPN
jgi:CheY-like chemotaxis protein